MSLLASSHVTIGYLVLLIISVHAVKVGQCFICFTWPDLPKFSELWVPLFSTAAKSGAPRWLDLADFLKGASQRVQVPWVLVLDFPQAQNHWWWALLTCKVAQVPTGQRRQRTNRMNASKRKCLPCADYDERAVLKSPSDSILNFILWWTHRRSIKKARKISPKCPYSVIVMFQTLIHWILHIP